MLNYSNFAQTDEMVSRWATGMGSGMGSEMGMMGGIGFIWLMPLFGLFILGLFVWFVVKIVTRSTDDDTVARTNKSSLDVLGERYARGKIDTEEFEIRRTALK